jgi:hypothetical protein
MVSLNSIALCCQTQTVESDSFLSNGADLAQVIIALFNIYLAYRVYKSDVKNTETQRQDESNSITLQGFKDFIVTPNFHHLQIFFSNLLELREKITVTSIDEELAINLNSYIKNEVSKFRVNFNDSILNVNRNLFNSIKLKVEELNDHLTVVISDGNFDLTDPQEFEQLIAYPINMTKNDVIALLVKYKGD